MLNRCVTESLWANALDLYSVLWRFWLTYSYLSEGRFWLQTVLEKTEGVQTPVRAMVLFGIGRLALMQQNLAEATQFFNEALRLYRELEKREEQGPVLNSLGEVALRQELDVQAKMLFEGAFGMFEAVGDNAGMVQSLNNLGQWAFFQGEYEQAQDFLARSLKKGQIMGHQRLSPLP